MLYQPATRLPALLALVLILAGPAVAQSGLKSEIAFYVDTYGEISPQQDPQVARAHRAFGRVRAVADKSSKRLPKLVVVNSRANPWAIALPDGHIVLSRRAVELCHRQVSPAEAEARLAFVLGHELAHLANDDFWHQEVHSFLATDPGGRRLAGFLRQNRRIQERELIADDKGYVYAAMAGYPVGGLLEAHPRGAHFFDFWMQQTSTQVQSSHPRADDRAALLQRRLSDLEAKLALFDFGVRLSHFDHCDDAVYFLKEFQKTFPSREVLNNLGYCHVQMARQEMDADRAYFYWMPLLLDGETRAVGLLRGPGDMPLKTLRQAAPGAGDGFLQEAVEYLERAAAADPAYVPARLNLAAAWLYRGRPHQARAALAEARELAPDNPALQALEALALYEQSEAGLDLWPTAIARLEALAAAPVPPPAALFNLARLLQVRPRPAEARRYWNRLAPLGPGLPAPIQAIVCAEQSAVSATECTGAASRAVRTPPWSLPLAASGMTQVTAAERRRLSGWQTVAFDWYRDKLHGSIYRRPDGGAEVLELDGFLQIQVLKSDNLGMVRDLQRYCPMPLRQRTLARGVVWSCGEWAAMTRGDRIQEVWWVAR